MEIERKKFSPSWTPAPNTATPSGTCSSAARLESIERRLVDIERTLLHLIHHIQAVSPAPTTVPHLDLGHVQAPPQVPGW